MRATKHRDVAVLMRQGLHFCHKDVELLHQDCIFSVGEQERVGYVVDIF